MESCSRSPAFGIRTIRRFDSASGKQTRLLETACGFGAEVAFAAATARALVSARVAIGRARIFASMAETAATYRGHEAPVLSAAFRAARELKAPRLRAGGTVHSGTPAMASSPAEISPTPAADAQVLSPTDFGLLTGSIDRLVRLLQIQRPSGADDLFAASAIAWSRSPSRPRWPHLRQRRSRR